MDNIIDSFPKVNFKALKRIPPDDYLDTAISCLISADGTGYLFKTSAQLVAIFLVKGIESDINLMNAVLNKLKKDGYASNDISLASGIMVGNVDIGKTSNGDVWFITVEGITFPGYSANAERDRSRNRSQKINNYLLLGGSWLASIAGAGLLYFEYVKLNHHNPYGCSFWKISGAVSILLIPVLVWWILPKKSK